MKNPPEHSEAEFKLLDEDEHETVSNQTATGCGVDICTKPHHSTPSPICTHGRRRLRDFSDTQLMVSALPFFSTEARAMVFYKLFLLRDGTPVRKIQIECRDDLDALDAARVLARDRVVEVYTGARLVARVRTGDAPPDVHDRT